MSDCFTVFGGWGIAPEVLEPVFGAGSVYIDSNELLQQVVHKEALSPEWCSELAATIRPRMHSSGMVAGWSTGAIIAYGCAAHLQTTGCVLIAGTPSFCRTSTFRSGMPASLVRSMRQRLSREPEAVLSDFRRECGLATDATSPYAVPVLEGGLDALMQMSLFNVVPPHCPTLFFHGENDTIIPIAAGRALAAMCGGSFVPLAGTHACFATNNDKICATITNYFGGMFHESV